MWLACAWRTFETEAWQVLFVEESRCVAFSISEGRVSPGFFLVNSEGLTSKFLILVSFSQFFFLLNSKLPEYLLASRGWFSVHFSDKETIPATKQKPTCHLIAYFTVPVIIKRKATRPFPHLGTKKMLEPAGNHWTARNRGAWGAWKLPNRPKETAPTMTLL